LFTEKIMPAGNAALISYDRLQDDTAKEFTRALSELGVDVNAEALGRAIPMASAREAADDETRRGRTLVASLDRGSFVRDGSVGQWREHFTADDLARIAALLDQCGVNPSDALPADAIT
ncbi:sulfotransferase domain-containing protein, partial [Ilumatobacter sp.]|uniref:sulfotransferase domain-containing protein n=1 Tax=Ilumatobacter sp. TaxID=1967498 RepID=UPI002A2DF45A|nr:sulfotransferase domain-containing protein [Ilumatobacter sp.]